MRCVEALTCIETLLFTEALSSFEALTCIEALLCTEALPSVEALTCIEALLLCTEALSMYTHKISRNLANVFS